MSRVKTIEVQSISDTNHWYDEIQRMSQGDVKINSSHIFDPFLERPYDNYVSKIM